MPKITKRFADAAEPRAARRIAWDDELPDFGLPVLSSGVKSYVARHRTVEGRDRRSTIGRHGVSTPDQERVKARKIVVARQGRRPAR
jgi:hypothetical protein